MIFCSPGQLCNKPRCLTPVQLPEQSNPFLFDHLGLCFLCCLCFIVLCNKLRHLTAGTLCPLCTTFSRLNFPFVLLLILCNNPRHLTAKICCFSLVISPVPLLFLLFFTQSSERMCLYHSTLFYSFFFGKIISFVYPFPLFFVFCLLPFGDFFSLLVPDIIPIFPLSLEGGTDLVFVFHTHRRTHRTHHALSYTHSDVHKCVQSSTHSDVRDIHKCVQTQKQTMTIFKLLVKISFLETVITTAKMSGRIDPVNSMT